MAAAFQEQLVKSLCLSDHIGPRRVVDHIGPRRVVDTKPKEKIRKKIAPVVDTGRGSTKQKTKVVQEKQEYVLDGYKQQPVTLAQRMGLVEAPAPKLSESDWHDVKLQSRRRDDSCQPCVICKDSFGLHSQVILSCSHVFHRNCLEAFERFTGKQSCPLCRKEEYQKRVIYEGEKQYRHHCATLIQATWRGYVVHSWYRKLRQSVPPKNPALRKQFFEEKLSSITDRMVASCSRRVDVFIREVDNNIAASRRVFDRFDCLHRCLTDQQWSQVQLKALLREDNDCPICLNKLRFNEKPDTTKHVKTETCQMNDKARARNLIHLTDTAMNTSQSTNQTTGRDDTVVRRQTVLLSCTHMFHRVCLETFEELTVGHAPRCPVCRDSYQKLLL